MRITAIFIISGISILSGCGVSPRERAARSARSDSHSVLVGTLTENVNKLISETSTAMKCDLELRPLILEIAKALDVHEKEIKKIIELQKNSQRILRSQFGPILVREEKPTAENETRHGWTETREGWLDYYKTYKRIKNRPYHPDWLDLNISARYTLSSDLTRQEGKNVFLDKDSGNRLQRALSAVNACINNKNCRSPVYESEAVRAWVGRVWGKTQSLGELSAQMQEDYSARYAFIRNPTIIRKSETLIELPLIASDFKGFEKVFSDYVEAFWKTATLGLQIRWVDPMAGSNFYELLAKPVPGERPNVDWTNQKVNLYSDIKKTDVAHELGHVLGFNDHYYEIYEPETCTYLTQFNYDDVMSEAETGGVTEEEVRMLRLNYRHFADAPAQQRNPIE